MKNKNIFLIGTDKESNLYESINGIFTTKKYLNHSGRNQFIYITTEEKIKDEEYGLVLNLFRQNFRHYQTVFRMDDGQREAMESLGGQKESGTLKVVLTNDPTLIADGVQEIQKSVLNSFVENPVEYVEVIYEPKNFLDTSQGWEHYLNFPQKKIETEEKLYSKEDIINSMHQIEIEDDKNYSRLFERVLQKLEEL